MKKSFAQLAAVVLAAGKGTRMKADEKNKVMFDLAGKPMIGYTTEMLRRVGFNQIVVVVGFAKDSVIRYLGDQFIYAEQKKQLGTAHALKSALSKIPAGVKNIFVCYSDDTAFYPEKVIEKLVNKHLKEKNQLTLLTVVKEDPTGLGRIVRDDKGKMEKIVEEKNASAKIKKIREINTGCYCFQLEFVKKYLPQIEKDPVKGEYYLTDIVGLAIGEQKKVATMKIDQGSYFQGINTPQQLRKAERLMKKRDGGF